VNLLILVVDDEPDVEVLFRQQFRHDLRAGRFTMDFAQSGDKALQRIDDAAGVSIILILSDINMPLCCSARVRLWHKASFAATHHFVACWSNNGQRLALGPDSSAAIDQMYGPAVRCKWILPIWR
jgi:CheY-like chemotaxis protein